jgi:hypothetical protein
VPWRLQLLQQQAIFYLSISPVQAYAMKKTVCMKTGNDFLTQTFQHVHSLTRGSVENDQLKTRRHTYMYVHICLQ